MKRLVVALLFAVLLMYLALKDIKLQEVRHSFSNVDRAYLLPAFFLAMGIAVFRSVRWGILLSPMEEIGQKKLFPITSFGYMASIIMPARLGEFVKPTLISKYSSISVSSAVATVCVERMMDLTCVLTIFLLLMTAVSLPAWIYTIGKGFFFVAAVIAVIGGLAYFKNRVCIQMFTVFSGAFPINLKNKIVLMIQTFVEGLQIVSQPWKLMSAILITVLIWGAAALVIYSLFLFQSFELPLHAAFVLLVIIAAGVSIPTAPGFLGNFQFACILSLSIFNIPKSEAVAFSISYYLLGIVIYIVLGLIFIPFFDFSFFKKS